MWTRCLIVALVGAISLPLLSQRPLVSEPDAVSLYVTVEDSRHQPVRGLTSSAFQVLDDRQPRPITKFETTVSTLMLMLLLDTSPSMDAVLVPVRSAAADFVAGLPARDVRRIGLMTQSEVLFSRMDDAGSPRDLRAYAMSARTGAPTAMWDALDAGLEDLKFGAGRRVIVVCSDGRDSVSRNNPRQIAEKARDYGVTVYTVSTPRQVDTPMPATSGDSSLKTLTEETGGAFLEVATGDDYAGLFARLAEELHGQYVISFVPSRLDGRAHDVSVQVNQRELTVRAPKSYLASRR